MKYKMLPPSKILLAVDIFDMSNPFVCDIGAPFLRGW